MNLISYLRQPPKPNTKSAAHNDESIAQALRGKTFEAQCEIKKINEQTDLLRENSFYSKIYTQLEKSHYNQYQDLIMRYHGSKNKQFYRELVSLYQENLNEWTSFIDIIQNNYYSGRYKNTRQDNISKIAKKNVGETEKPSAPNHLLDPLTCTIFVDPVITPSGITYEKAVLLEHLQKNGKFDPVSREPLNENQVYPNLLVKEQAAKFISDNWLR